MLVFSVLELQVFILEVFKQEKKGIKVNKGKSCIFFWQNCYTRLVLRKKNKDKLCVIHVLWCHQKFLFIATVLGFRVSIYVYVPLWNVQYFTIELDINVEE